MIFSYNSCLLEKLLKTIHILFLIYLSSSILSSNPSLNLADFGKLIKLSERSLLKDFSDFACFLLLFSQTCNFSYNFLNSLLTSSVFRATNSPSYIGDLEGVLRFTFFESFKFLEYVVTFLVANFLNNSFCFIYIKIFF